MKSERKDGGMRRMRQKGVKRCKRNKKGVEDEKERERRDNQRGEGTEI